MFGCAAAGGAEIETSEDEWDDVEVGVAGGGRANADVAASAVAQCKLEVASL